MLRRTLIGLAVLLTLVVVAVLAVDWDGLARGYIVRTLQARTGRDVQLERVRIHAQLPLRIELVGLRIANPQWAEHQPLLGLQSADLTIRLLPLLTRRELVLPQVALVRPEANLEQRDGERSWAFDRDTPKDDGQEPALPQIRSFGITDATVRYVDAQAKTALTVRASQAARGGQAQRLVFDVAGSFKGEKIQVEGNGASLLTLMDEGDPYPLKVDARVGKTAASFDGEVVNPAKLERVSGNFAIQGDNLEHLYRLVGVTLPATPPYRVKGRLLREGALWRLQGFEGGMGDSDLSGDLAYDAGQKPPMLHAQLNSKLLDLDDLGPLVGAPPKTGPGETASAEQKKQAQALAHEREVVPEKGFKTERWGRLNAQVALEAARVRRQKWLPIDKLSARMTLRDHVIELAPLRFGVASGNVDSTIHLDGRKDPLAVRATTRFRNLQLNRLMPDTKGGRTSTGSLFGDAQLAASGSSMKAMTESLDGQVHLTLGPGRVSELVFEALGLDAAEIARIFATGDDTVRSRCMVANLGIQDGMANVDALVFATEDANVMGTGRIDLAREQLDLTLYTAPKDMSPVSFRAPLHVRGTFKDPQVRPDTGVLAAKAGAAVLLGLVNPILAVVPLIETGPGTDSSCGELIQQAKGWKEAKDPTAKAVRRDEEKQRTQPAAPTQNAEAPRAADLLREGRDAGAQGTERSKAARTPGQPTPKQQAEATAGDADRRARKAGAPPKASAQEPEDAPRAEDLLKKNGNGG